MTIVLSLFLLGLGGAVLVNTVLTPSATPPERAFPRRGLPVSNYGRGWAIAAGGLLALGGVTMLCLTVFEIR